MTAAVRRMLLVALLLSSAAGTARAAVSLPSGFVATEVVQGLSSPTSMTLSPDGRIFVTERQGALRVVQGGLLLPTPFVTLAVDADRERGLLGVALDPDFPRTPYLYVYYTAFKPVVHNRLSRFTAAGNRAAAGSEKVLVDFPRLDKNVHNGGSLHFDPDGMLYLAVGENGVPENAQSLQSPLGKVLRFRRDGTIPADNPFSERTTGLNKAIWALGLRNPFTFTFSRAGRLFVNDVGNKTWEEIDEGVAGANYGWPLVEGPSDNPAYRAPIYAYRHGPTGSSGCAITGGAFYDPPVERFPESYRGAYFFADFCSGWIRRLDPARVGGGADPTASFAQGIEQPVDLDVADDGTLWYLAYSGSIARIDYTGSLAPHVTASPADQRVAVGSPVSFTVAATGAAPLTYQWRRDGAAISGANAASYTLATTALADDGARFDVVIGNAQGSATSAAATLRVVDGHAPRAVISGPTDGTRYDAGEVFSFAGAGQDDEDGALAPAALTWRIDFHHRDHVHPFLASTSGVSGGQLVIAADGETATDVWYRIHLEVRDSSGLTGATHVDLLPRTAMLRLASDPPGLSLTLDGTPRALPYAEPSVVGMRRTLAAPSPQSLGLATYELAEWSDGGAAAHVIATPASDTTFTARFRQREGAAHGLVGAYYSRRDLSGPALLRLDPEVSFAWENGSPIPGEMPVDQWSARWTGELLAPASGSYTFVLRSDAGARLWLDGKLLIDDWQAHTAHNRSAQKTLVAGRRYAVKLEYFEDQGPALLRLLWTPPGGTRQVIPTTQLSPTP